MAADPDSEWIDDYAPGEGGTLTGEAVNLDLHPTGFILRAAGALIDFAAYVVVLHRPLDRCRDRPLSASAPKRR